MKTMKRIAALMLALCMLIALPMAVGAEDTATPLTITSVLPNAWSTAENMKIKFTFSENVNSGADTAAAISANVFAAVGIYAGANGEGLYRYTWDDTTGTCTKVAKSNYDGQTGTTQWALSNFARRSQGQNQLMGNLPSGWTINKILAVYEKVRETYPDARLVGKVNDKSGAEDGYVDGIFSTADPTKKLSTIDCSSGLDWSERTIVNSVDNVKVYENGLLIELTRTLPNATVNSLTYTLGLYKDGTVLTDGPTWTVNAANAKFYGAGQKALWLSFDQYDAVKTALAANDGYSVGLMMTSTQTNAAGTENMISGVGGDVFSCNAMVGDNKAIFRTVTVVEDSKLEMIDAKMVGDNQLLITFNRPVAWSNKVWAGLSLYKSKTNNGMMAYKMNEDQTAYVYDTVGTIGAANVNGDGVTTWKRGQWAINVNFEPFGQDGNQIIATLSGSVTNDIVMAACKEGIASGLDLRFRVQENANQGEYKNWMVDPIWAADDENNKLLGSAEDGQTQAWISLSERMTGGAVIGTRSYESVAAALAEAKSGESVVMITDAKVDMVKVPAGVTLDLNGRKLTTDVMIAFGEVADGTDGNGKIVISKDGAKGAIHLQADNAAMPLYDADGYRFFTYTEDKLGYKTVTDAEENVVAVKFGIRFTFDNAEAYDLMAHADNADQVIVKLEGVKGEKTQKFNYYLNTNTLQAYADAVKNGTVENPAITLTVSGISNLDSISGTPGFVSPTEMVYVGQTGTYAAQ